MSIVFRFTDEELENLIYNFASLYNYDVSYATSASIEGKLLDLTYYNSPMRRSFEVKLSYDERADIEWIADQIIEAYQNRLK